MRERIKNLERIFCGNTGFFFKILVSSHCQRLPKTIKCNPNLEIIFMARQHGTRTKRSYGSHRIFYLLILDSDQREWLHSIRQYIRYLQTLLSRIKIVFQ